MMKETRKLWGIAALMILFSFLFTAAVSSTLAQVPKIVEVVVLENGIYDSLGVLSAISEYAESIKSSLDFDCNIVKLPLRNNDPRGIDDFIQSRYLAGTKIFILVGNDLKWPLSIGTFTDGTPAAVPADGVLCDTDGGELSIKDDGLHQPISPFTAEVTVSYIFPPKSGISTDTQVKSVADTFRKFTKYHQGKLIYEKKAVICGHFSPPPDPLGFQGAIDRMASACEQIFGDENVTKKELSSFEVKTYLEQGSAFFGVAGHGSPQVVETSSLGDYLRYEDLSTSSRGPMLLEILGCWTSGWEIRNMDDPWSAPMGRLSEAGIFENLFNIATISGNPGPESTSDYSFSNQVLSQIPSHPKDTIGELMIGKKRRSTDWTLFGDPTVRLDITGGGYVNERPVAYIDSISPNPAEEGTNVYFKGHAIDNDGIIVGYRWWSNLQGELSQSAAFNTLSLSVGTHNIHFKAQDDNGDWSEEVIRLLTIMPGSSLTILSPVDGETITGTTIISVSTTLRNVIAVNFYIDDTYSGYDKTPPYEYHWNTILYSNGQHKIQAKAYTDKPVMTYSSKTITVTINNPLPTLTITFPSNGSRLAGTCSIDVMAENGDKVSRVCFYVDGIVRGYDYSSPFQWSWDTSSYSNGPHVVYVDAFYTNLYRYVSSKRITVFVNNAQVQQGVTITSPSNNQQVSGTIIVNVEVTGANLYRVYLYVDGKWSGYGVASCCQFSLNTASLSNGPHEIYAVALYGARPPHTEIRSETIRVIVNNSI